jgi:PhnB protein
MPDTFIEPYLFFGGSCEEALDFYRTTRSAQVEILLCHKDSPEPLPPGLLLDSKHVCFRR